MEADEKACPLCAETIKAAATKCKHCGEMLTEREPTAAPTIAYVSGSGQGEGNISLAAYQAGWLVSVFLLLAGGMLFVYALNMDVTVATPEAEIIGISRVANIHLIAQQNNYRNAGGLIFFAGLIGAMFLATRTPSAPSATPASTPSPLSKNVDWESKMSPQQKQFGLIGLFAVVLFCLMLLLDALT